MKFIKQNYVQNVVITIGERMTCWAPLLKIPPALGMIGDNVNLIDGLMGDDRNPYFLGIIFCFVSTVDYSMSTTERASKCSPA